jgi:hypothetical protein
LPNHQIIDLKASHTFARAQSPPNNQLATMARRRDHERINRLERTARSLRMDRGFDEDPGLVYRELAIGKYHKFTVYLRCLACGHEGSATVTRAQFRNIVCGNCRSTHFYTRPQRKSR